MGSSETSTEELLLRARQGDSTAQQNLLGRYRPRLVQIITARMDRRLRGRVDPSDVVQEALVEAHQNLDNYLRDCPLPFFPWLRKLAWNRLVDLFRQHVRAQKRSVLREELPQLALPEESVLELSERLVAGNTSPSDAAGRQELRLRVLAVLQHLSDNDREVLTLRYLEGLTAEETAAVLGISESAAKVRHFRALERVRRQLEDSDEDAHV